MAMTATPIGNRYPFGDRMAQDYNLAFSGNYPDEGEPVTSQTFGFANKIDRIIFHNPLVRALDGESGVIVSYNSITSAIECYESGASGTALLEKTAAEAYPVLAGVPCTVVGY